MDVARMNALETISSYLRWEVGHGVREGEGGERRGGKGGRGGKVGEGEGG